MKISRRYYIAVFILLAVFLTWIFSQEDFFPPEIDEYTRIGHLPKISPDYSGVTIPPNIAPLNFLIKEKAELYYVKIYSKNGNEIKITSKSPKIEIPQKRWTQLLKANKLGNLYIDVYIKREAKGWELFDRIENRIAGEDIDNYLVYRKIRPGFDVYDEVGVYQRDLRNFREVPILEGKSFSKGCVNCHSFCNNSTDTMSIAIRSAKYSSNSIMIDNGEPTRIGTKFGYTAWHPSGKVAAYSSNLVRQFFHGTRDEIRDVIDFDSAIAYYSVAENDVKTTPVLSRKNRLETYPAWSPDGKYLYFCSAEKLWTEKIPSEPKELSSKSSWIYQVKYDLVRVSYDIETDKWGEVETILSAEKTGLSILEPRISPDGRWLLFCMCDYGCFPVYQKSSDLYLIDLKAPRENGQYEYKRLAINSDESESWHSFSSNSRWIAFSSKMGYGEFTRTYFSYIDDKGMASKPILMPQKDPTFYDTCLKTYSVPELVIKPVPVKGERIARVVRYNSTTTVDMPITMATPKPGEGTDRKDTPIWNERE